MEDGILFIPSIISLDGLRRFDRTVMDLAAMVRSPDKYVYQGFAFGCEDDRIVAIVDDNITGETYGVTISHTDLWTPKHVSS